MNAAAANADDKAELFAEIAELKRQRDDCTRKLLACQRENTELRAQLKGKNK